MNKVTKFEPKENGRNYSGDKRLTDARSLVAHRNGKLFEVIACRCYMGRSSRASVVYASVWIRSPGVGDKPGFYAAGHQQVGGGGYHKSSAAIGGAIRSAGITLQNSIWGVGDSAVDDALTAIARYLGYRNTIIVRH